MRINVYAEELIDLDSTEKAVEVITKTVNQELFYGIRFYLHSAKELHYGASDDDRSAITIWVPWTKKKGHDPIKVLNLLNDMQGKLSAEAYRRGDLE